MRRIAVVTTARSDYGIYLPILRRIEASDALSLQLIAGGAHLSEEYGHTIKAIEDDGFAVDATVEMVPESDEAAATAVAMGQGVIGFARAYATLAPDLLLVLGDRFEMLSAAVAALPQRLPLAHIHGGELTEGSLDDATRHAITKMSHLHFVATEEYAKRIVGMGEEPWRVTVSGAPALDNLREMALPSREEVGRAHGLDTAAPFLLVTYHPETLEHERTGERIGELLGGLDEVGMPVVFTYPNADMGSRTIIERVHAFVAEHPRASVAPNLGTRAYFSLMRDAAAMVGNSSSGIIEAASFSLPVVNIGDRQQGRVRARNVIDCPPDRASIAESVRRAVSPSFRGTLEGLRNPYGDGGAAERIVSVIAQVPLDARLLRKRFYVAPVEHTPSVATAAAGFDRT